MTSTRIKHTDEHGNRYVVEFEDGSNPYAGPNLGEFVGMFWGLIKAQVARDFANADPVAALAEHEWYGDEFEKHFNHTTEDDR